jgi:hypothetical protein
MDTSIILVQLGKFTFSKYSWSCEEITHQSNMALIDPASFTRTSDFQSRRRQGRQQNGKIKLSSRRPSRECAGDGGWLAEHMVAPRLRTHTARWPGMARYVPDRAGRASCWRARSSCARRAGRTGCWRAGSGRAWRTCVGRAPCKPRLAALDMGEHASGSTRTRSTFFFCPFDSNGLLSVILICSCIKYWTDEYVTLYCRLTQITAYVQMPLTGAGPIPACEKHCRRKNSSLLSIFTCTTHQPFSLLSINLTTNPSSLLYAWVNIHRPHDQVSRNIALSVHPENGSDRGTTTYRARNNEE